MTEHTTAPRSPAALAAHLGLTVPQLAQMLASVTQGEGLTAEGVTLQFDRMGHPPRVEHLTAAEVLGVLAECPGAAQPEPVPVLDVTHPFFSRASELCWAAENYLAGEGTRAELGAAAARLMPLLGFAPERAQAVRLAALNLSTPQRCPRCDGEGEYWAAPYENPRECPECEGRGVLDTYTPDGPPDCPVCDGTGTPEPDALSAYQTAQAERRAASTPLKPTHPAPLADGEL